MAVMTNAYLTCGTCGKEFPLNMYSTPKEIQCPFCLAKVDYQMIELIKTAWGAATDVNNSFINNNADNPRFSLNLKCEELHLPSDED